MKIKLAFAAAVLGGAMIAPGPAAAWDLVGSRDVKDRTERDTVSVGGGKQWRRIKLCVAKRPVHFIDVDIIFENGGHQDVRVAERINPGDCTRAIDLEGGVRNIDRIVMVYEETSFKRRHARVKVYAE